MIKVENSDFKFETDEESITYLVEIIEIMMTRFGITSAESKGRINNSFSHLSTIIGEEEFIYREFPSYWANHFYFGKESFWWVEGEERENLNLPKLKPNPYNGKK